jgi:hypothetical protein
MARLRNPRGSRGKFERCVEAVSARGGAYDPRAVCAAQERREIGQRELTRRAIAGKRRAARRNALIPETPYEHGLEDGLYDLRNGLGPLLGPSLTDHAERLGYTGEDLQRFRTGYNEGYYRHNPYESAAELSEAFHGRPAEYVEHIATPIHEHRVLTTLGELVSIELKDGTDLEFDANTMLSSNEAGTHLFIDGGDQSVDLSIFPELDATKEAVTLGKVKYVTYWTAKYHLGKRDETPGPYRHKLGEESGDLPSLDYDVVNRLLSFVGGHYHIDFDLERDGMIYSAGIRD